MKKIKKLIRLLYVGLISSRRINITKTLYINLKLFPLIDALKFPIYIYGSCRLTVAGRVNIAAPIKMGLLKIGYKYEMLSYKVSSVFRLYGTLVLKGEVWFGSAISVYIGNDAMLEMGNMSSLGSCGNLICTKSIIFSDYSRIGSWSTVTDSNYHYMKDVLSGKINRKEREVFIGARNYIGSRSALLPGTKTPDNITIAFGTVCNRDYTKDIPENSVIAGVPAKLVKANIVRVFESNRERVIDEYFESTNSMAYYEKESIN
jgi:acetyltransferase-like isoleucine patch superfamily enzyme